MASLLIRIKNLQIDIFETILKDLSVWDINEIAKIDRGHYEIVKSSLVLFKKKVFQVHEYKIKTPWVIPEFLLSANLEILLRRDSEKHRNQGLKSNFGIPSMLTDNLYVFLSDGDLKI